MRPFVFAGLEPMAEALGCSRKTLYRWIQDRGFPAFKMDGVWRALPGEVETWLAEQRARAAAEGGGTAPRREAGR